MLNRMFFTLVMAIFFLPTTSLAQTEEEPDPSRIRLLIHDSREMGNNIDARIHFIPTPNLLEGNFTPLVYISLGFKQISWLDVEPAIGWNFSNNNPILSLRLAPSFWRIYAWIDAELCIPSWDGYWFVQLEYKLTSWLHIGIEGEGWGNYLTIFSNGGGPNVIVNFEHLAIDFTVHVRDFGHVTRPELFARIHIRL